MLTWKLLAVEILTILPQLLVSAWITCRLLPLRRPALFTAVYTAVLFAIHLVTLRLAPAAVGIKPLLQITAAAALPCLFTTGRRLVAVSLTLLLCTVMVLMELLVVVLTQWSLTDTGLDTLYQVSAPYLLLTRTAYNVVYGLMLMPVYYLWKRTCNSGIEYAAPELLPFLLSQAAMTILACALVLTETGRTVALNLTAVAAGLLGLLAMGLAFYVYFANQAWYALEQRRQAAAHGAALQRRRQEAPSETEIMRQELRARLDEAMERLSRRETDGAREQVLSANEVLRASRPTSCCSHPVADAVLWEQSRRCAAAGIRLEILADLPAELGVSGAAVCSLFSNILDNAVHACLALPPEERWIRCTAVCRGTYLIVRAENPRDPAAPRHAGPSSGLGLGLPILSELARRCDGSVETEKTGDRFRITVCLRRSLPEAGEEAVG